MATIDSSKINHVQHKANGLLQVLVKDLEDWCASDSLSLDSVQKKIRSIPTYAMKESCVLHKVCSNKNVTLDIIECLLDAYPLIGHGYVLLSSERDPARAHPLDLACRNDYCPTSVIELLLKKNPMAFRHPTPLCCYLSRKSNIDLEVVKKFATTYPAAIAFADDDTGFTPIHTILDNPNVDNVYEILKLLLEMNPSSLQVPTLFTGDYPIHIACRNNNMNSKIIQFLLNLWPESSTQQCNNDALPLHSLCRIAMLNDSASLEILRLLLGSYPEAVWEADAMGYLPIHRAARCNSWEFCKMLIDMHPESVMTIGAFGTTVFHFACSCRGTIETVTNLYNLYPEAINIQADDGVYPIHDVFRLYTGKDKIKIIKFLLEHDPDSASRATIAFGRLPLHFVCYRSGCLALAKLLFDAHPYAICKRDARGESPIDLATESGNLETAAFLRAQLEYATKAKDKQLMTTPDDNGRLPLHRALVNKACLGTIKLLVDGNPAALQVADSNEMLPLHIACEFGTLSIVQLLVELYSGSLNIGDAKKELPLHYACRGGNCDTVMYVLEEQGCAATERNIYKKLPIHLLCEASEGNVDRRNSKYIEAIWRLLLVSPEIVSA